MLALLHVLEEKHSKKKTNHGVSSIQLKIANVIAFIITLIFNGISSAGLISPFGIGTVSRKRPTKITPAGSAFAIWGYIYNSSIKILIKISAKQHQQQL